MIVFFGSPDFAVESLKKLIKTEYRPGLVVTQPDRPAGRGRKTVPTPVRVEADRAGIPVKIIGSFKEKGIVEQLESLRPDFFVVAAFGLIFPDRVLAIPSRECLNLHASLLPAYRGASPINAAVTNGDSFTGVSTMRMVAELDAGPVFLQRVIPIDPMETAGELFVRLAEQGARLLLDTMRGIVRSGLRCREQGEEGVTFAPMLKKADGLIPWRRSALEVHNHIRGMNPWPGSFTFYRGSYIKIHRTEPIDLILREERAGTVLESSGRNLLVACGRGAVRINRLQAEGKKPLGAEEFLRGFEIRRGGLFTFDKERPL